MANLSTLTDDFNAGSVDTAKWDVFLSGAATITQSSGQLVLVSPTSQSAQLNSKSHVYTLVGSSASLQLVSAGTRVANSSFNFLLRTNTNNDLIYWDLTNTTLSAYWDNGTLTQIATTTYNSATHQWLRIRESGGTIFWDYSANGISWTNFATMLISSFGAYSGVEADITNIQNGTGTITMLVDNFNVFNASISQIAGGVTATGGMQSIATVNSVSISQVAANATASAGTQGISTVRLASVSQAAATITVTGGTQAVSSLPSSNIAQLAATLTATGGVQSIATTRIVAISQVGGTITTIGGTQSIQSLRNISIAQIRALVTATGGVQSIAIRKSAPLAQLAATLMATSGTQKITTQQINDWIVRPVIGTHNKILQTGAGSNAPQAGGIYLSPPPTISL